jgi:hypothetical protein
MNSRQSQGRGQRLLVFLLVEPYDMPVTRDWLFWLGLAVGVATSAGMALVTEQAEPWPVLFWWAWFTVYWMFGIPACGLRAFLRGWRGAADQPGLDRSAS